MAEFNLFLGVFEIIEAKSLAAKLNDMGIVTDLRVNPSTCSTGCKVTVEMWGKESDGQSLQDYFRQLHLKNLEGHQLNYEAMNQIFDESAETVICQACGFKFSPKLTECPDCGLCYG